MGTLDTPSRDDRPDELLSPAEELPKEAAGQNVERSTTDDLAKALDEYRPPGPDDIDVDFESYDPKFRPGQVVVIGRADAPDNPKRYAVVGEGVEVQDLPIDEPLPDNPAGDEYIGMDPIDRSRGRDLLKGTVEHFDDVADAIQKAGNQLEGSLKSPEPTGTGTKLPPGTPIYDTAPNTATAGSAALGILELAVLTTAAVRVGIKHYKDTNKETADNGGN
jgi:hypothetical protein